MRAVLIVNPNATSTTPAGRDLLAHALESRVGLVISHTDHRGHAIEIAEAAKRDGTDVIIVHGGDGTVNEVVNGLLGAPGPSRPDPATLPAVAVVPGGSANVFARALGISADPIEATNQLIDLLGAHGRGEPWRRIGLMDCVERWAVFTAGMGVDGDVVAAVEAHGARLGLWYSPGGVGALQFNPQLGLEPAVISGGVKKGNYCVAAPRHRQALLEVIRTQVRTHRLRAVIFDFFSGVCGGEDHGHLPHRPYSLEAMLDAHFELIAALRQEQEDLWVIDWESPTFAFSPWLLMHVDAVWLGWSDAAMATGMPTPLPQVSWMITGRDAMTFREARCLDGQGRFVPEPFPPWATDRFVFNDLHEPQHEVGRPAYYGYRSDNLIMGLSRGGLTWIFWPLPEHYQDSDYAFFASALRWGQSRRVVLSGMRPLLGDPEQRGAYAYGNFEQGRGIVTVRNPFARSERFSLALGERLGMEAGETSAYVAQVVYPYHAYLDGEYRRGDTLCGEIPGYQAMTIELVHRDTLPGPVPLGTRARSEEGQWVLHGPPGTDRIVNWLHPDGRREEMLVCFPGSAGALQVPVARLRKTGDSVLGVIELEIPAHYTDCMLLVLAEGDTDEPVFCRVDHYDDHPGTLSRPLTERSPRDPTFMGNPYNMPVPNWTFFSTPLGRGRHRLNVSLSCSERQGWARGQWVRPLRGWVSVWLWTREPLTAVRGAATSVSAAEPLPLPMAQDVDQQLVALIPPTYVNTRVVASETIVSV